MGLITTGEVFFNNVAFDVFGKSAPTTFIMALAVGLSIPLCAYMAGLWLRQWPSPWHKTAIKFTALLGNVVFALFAVNTARLVHLETNPELAIDPRLNCAFLTMNIVMLAAVVILTYLTYDPVPGFKEVKSKWEKPLRRCTNWRAS
jgi:hypothetical protein